MGLWATCGLENSTDKNKEERFSSGPLKINYRTNGGGTATGAYIRKPRGWLIGLLVVVLELLSLDWSSLEEDAGNN